MAAGALAHTLPFAEIIIGLMLLIGWRLKIWATLVTLIMLGFLSVVTRAYLLHMDINCGCFGTPEKLDRHDHRPRFRHLRPSPPNDLLHLHRVPRAAPVGPPIPQSSSPLRGEAFPDANSETVRGCVSY